MLTSAALAPSSARGAALAPLRQSKVAGLAAPAGCRGKGPAPHLPGGRASGLRVAAIRDEGDSTNRKKSDADFQTNPLLPAFTRRREHTIGRVAALGFAFSLVGELVSGLGPLSQLHYETGLSYKWLYILALGFAGWQLVGGLLPGAPTYDVRNRMDLQERPRVSPLKNPRKFLAQNEVVLGRLAMAAFTGACVLEWLWGGEAPLAHLGFIQPGTPLTLAPWWAIGTVGLFLATGLGLFSPGGNDETF